MNFKIENISNQIKEFNVVSFDIFDTLIVRSFCKPKDLFKYIDEILGNSGFCEARIFAEKKARENGIANNKEDITLDEIYNCIEPKYSNLKDVEKKLEEKLCKYRPDIKKIYAEAIKQNKKIIIITDMYLPRETIETILHKNRYANYSKLYISSEISKTKLTGNLFKYVIDDLQITPNKMLHVGDNDIRDIKNAENYDIKTFKVTDYIEEFLNNKNNLKFKQFYIKEEENIYSSILISKIAYYMFSDNKSDIEKLSYIFAGIIGYSYVQFIIKVSKMFDSLLFCARDGYILNEIYNILCDMPKPNYYVFASRKIIANVIEATKNYDKYINYIKNLDIIGNNVLTIDMITQNFSSQKFLTSILKNQNVHGCFFANSKQYSQNINYPFIFMDRLRFFKEYHFYHIIEYLYSSPEPAINAIENNAPVYSDYNDEYYVKQFPLIENGILSFSKNMKYDFGNIYIPENTINNFIYCYLENLNNSDINFLSSINAPAGSMTNDDYNSLYSLLTTKQNIYQDQNSKISFISKLFSVRNEYSEDGRKRKIITILGMKIKLKRKK